MFKLFKYGIILAVIVVIALFAMILTTDVNQYKPQLIELVKKQTQRDFDIAGELKLAPSLIPTIKVDGVTFGNASWGEKKPMLNVGEFEAEVALMPLLQKEIQINKLILNRPDILLETNKDGKGNWVLDIPAASGDSSATSSQGLDLNVNEVSIREANLLYRDGKTGKTTEVNVDRIEAKSKGRKSPLELVVEATVNGAPLSLDGAVGSLDSLMNNQETPVDIDLSLDKATLTASGRIAKPKTMEGIDIEYDVAIDELSDLSRVAGSDLPSGGPIKLAGSLKQQDGGYVLTTNGNVVDATIGANGKITDGKNFSGLAIDIDFSVDSVESLSDLAGSKLPDAGPVKITGKLTDTKGGYALSNLRADVMEYSVAGDLAVSTSGQRPAVSGNLTTDVLDLSKFTEGTDESDSAKPAKLFSSEPLPLETLKSADVNLSFKANKLITSSMTLDKMSVKVKLNNGKLDVAPFTGNLAGGVINANVTLDGSSGKTVAFAKQATIKQLELGQLSQFKGKDMLSGGKTDLTVNITGNGKSIAEIMAGSNGKLLMQTGEGRLYNKTIDIAGADIVFSALNMMNPLSEQEEYTNMECGVVSFDISDGMATTDRGIALQTGKMNIVGSGTLNFKTEAVDLAVKPQAREGLGISLGSLVDVVSIGGTLANPSPKVDSAKALTTGLTAGAAVATGGLSLLAEGLFNKATADSNPCDTALGKAPKPAVQEKKASPVESAGEKVESVKDSAGEKVENVKEKAEDSVKDALKKLF